MAKVFLIGTTGHIGGAILQAITTRRPDIEITTLVRNEEKGRRLKERFPSVDPLIGDLESTDVIEFASRDANIVINTAPDVGHEGTIAAIKRGLSSLPRKGWYMHTSGAGLIWSAPDGTYSDKIWDDVADIEQLTSMPDSAIHRSIDRAVFASAPHMNVAIVSPTFVYGLSPAAHYPTPITVPELVTTAKAVSAGYTIGVGGNKQSFVHVDDLANIYYALLEDALKGADSDPALWGPQAYYFGAGNEELTFREYMQAVMPILKAKGVIASDEIKVIDSKKAAEAVSAMSGDETSAWTASIADMFGVNMRCRAARARKLLGWVPTGPRVKETLPEVLSEFLKKEGRR
ncbi:uncharacterized protein K452DRAFT_272103 [Aplosporella prunicola CBS 121167]|uniref:NAD(P)-binding domain-containing protein n=1 Tax=Aplosporella prunicola CBS 121167 TaxID=1176127 RepID=A0A6A6BD79_9PEZI|nr:uncharacterized protein K452DRAFT_272103 [Aplosporella prunicola CBS 121167]KAF2141333.1 hypothetical protein K452DRAFT_272103 [Aplosporella prunicola CBS 121167]